MAIDLNVIVLTLNEEINLPKCLDSIAPLGSDVFVVDSGSTDQTVEIAKSSGAVVVEHPFENYGAQRNWAQANLPLKSEWALHLDADEFLTPELRSSIAQALGHAKDDVNGFLLRRRTVFMGRWIKHGGHYPSYHARLYRRDKGHCEDRLYDQHFVVEGKVEKLPGDMIDTTPDLSDWTLRHVKWAAKEAEEQMLAGTATGRLEGRLTGTPIEKKRWLRDRVYGKTPLLARPLLYFLYRYFLRLGFLDGREGLIFHFLQGFWYRFQVDAYIHEQRLREQAASSTNVDGQAGTEANNNAKIKESS